MIKSQRSEVTVLVAEDSRIQRDVLAGKLREAGFQVRAAEDGAIALDRIREQRPTVVISDIEMPNMTGYQLCDAVKSDASLRSIPFILLSTLSDPQDIIRGLHCGADNYVTKPYDPEFLIGRVESLLATPLDDEEEAQPLEVTLAGERYTVNSGRQQVLNLLASTFENAVEKNHELIRSNQELMVAQEKLVESNKQLEELNGELNVANEKMRNDLNAAARVQQSLLPSGDADTSCATITWKYHPCDELAGDFLNVIRLSDRHLAAYLVDVCGHGVASSLLAVTIGRLLTPHSGSSSIVTEERDGVTKIVAPIDVALELNKRLPEEENGGLWFTMVYGILDLETLEFRHVRAGHPELVHVARDGAARSVPSKGMPIGVIENMLIEEQTVQLGAGDRLYMYSDGVPEAMDAKGNLFGVQQTLDVLELGVSQSLEESVESLMAVVKRWSGDRTWDDDLSILGLEVRP
ncbi:MAG: PP2C family protein-serine/threonine phosphatase [Planctomycetota bacterium]